MLRPVARQRGSAAAASGFFQAARILRAMKVSSRSGR
jgi:hypothetical protein